MLPMNFHHVPDYQSDTHSRGVHGDAKRTLGSNWELAYKSFVFQTPTTYTEVVMEKVASEDKKKTASCWHSSAYANYYLISRGFDAAVVWFVQGKSRLCSCLPLSLRISSTLVEFLGLQCLSDCCVFILLLYKHENESKWLFLFFFFFIQ